MAEKAAQKRGKSFIQGTFLNLGRLFISLFIPFTAFAVLYAGFIFLRDSKASQGVIALVAILWGDRKSVV